jgi:hypothetical protein
MASQNWDRTTYQTLFAFDVAKNHLSTLFFGSLWLIVVYYYFSGPKVNLEVVGRKWWWEPQWLTKMRFFHNGWAIVGDGYSKVSVLVASGSWD